MKKITLLIPCHNEEKGIAKVLEQMPREKLSQQGYSLETIVIDNNSTDDTVRVAQKKGATVISESKQGKGNAMITGFNAVSKDTEFVVMMDGDNTYKPQEILRLIEPLDNDFCDVVVGSRLAGRTFKDSLKFKNRLANWFYTFLVRYFYLANVTDVLSGYFAWKKSAVDQMVPHLKANGFAIEMEMITKMKRLGFEMYSVPITYDTREGETKLNVVQDGLRIFTMFLKNFLWSPIQYRDPSGKPHVVKFVSYTYPFTGSGLGNVAQIQAEKLAEIGHHVSLVSTNYPKSNKVFRLKNVQHVKIPGLHFLMRLDVPVPIPFITPSLIKLVRSADVVHVHGAMYPTSAIPVLIAKIFRKPIVLTQHVPFIEYPNAIINTVQKIVLVTMGRFVFSSTDQIIVLNEAVKSMLQSYEHKVQLIPNGVDTELFHPVSLEEKQQLRTKHGFDIDRNIVLFVGRLVPKKGFDIVYNLQSENYLVVCVGAGEVPLQMQNNPNVLFLGNQSQHELKELYQLSDLFILPSYGEGFPLVIQEAMASGLPVITTDHSEYHNYVDSEHVRLVPRTVDSFRVAIDEVINNNQMRQIMADYSRQRALEMFSWEDSAGQIVMVYENVRVAKDIKRAGMREIFDGLLKVQIKEDK